MVPDRTRGDANPMIAGDEVTCERSSVRYGTKFSLSNSQVHITRDLGSDLGSLVTMTGEYHCSCRLLGVAE